MLYRTVRLAAFFVVLGAASSAQPPALPTKMIASTEVGGHERWIVFHLRDAANAPEFLTALVRALDPKQKAGSDNPPRARVWPPRISTLAPGVIVVEFDTRVPGLARLVQNVQLAGDTR